MFLPSIADRSELTLAVAINLGLWKNMFLQWVTCPEIVHFTQVTLLNSQSINFSE